MEDLRQGGDITYFRHLKEGQTVANFVDAGSLSSVHSRLAIYWEWLPAADATGKHKHCV